MSVEQENQKLDKSVSYSDSGDHRGRGWDTGEEKLEGGGEKQGSKNAVIKCHELCMSVEADLPLKRLVFSCFIASFDWESKREGKLRKIPHKQKRREEISKKNLQWFGLWVI